MGNKFVFCTPFLSFLHLLFLSALFSCPWIIAKGGSSFHGRRTVSQKANPPPFRPAVVVVWGHCMLSLHISPPSSWWRRLWKLVSYDPCMSAPRHYGKKVGSDDVGMPFSATSRDTKTRSSSELISPLPGEAKCHLKPLLYCFPFYDRCFINKSQTKKTFSSCAYWRTQSAQVHMPFLLCGNAKE